MYAPIYLYFLDNLDLVKVSRRKVPICSIEHTWHPTLGSKSHSPVTGSNDFGGESLGNTEKKKIQKPVLKEIPLVKFCTI
jgi:hypothetical protein